MRNFIFQIVSIFLLTHISPTWVHACGFESTFRSYLDRRFWQPFAKYEKALGDELPQRILFETPFAGMTTANENPTLQPIRAAYQEATYDACRKAVDLALTSKLTKEEREEVDLIAAKIDLREGEADQPSRLVQAREKLETFLKSASIPTYQSEARGWLARVYFLQGDYAAAAKIYLDELDQHASAFSRESLVTSLRLLFPYNGTSTRLMDHLEEYFDTPTHALFVVNIVTNPVYFDEQERALMAEIAQKTLAALQSHTELFQFSDESESLALALMRTALYMGDIPAVLTYARQIPASSQTATKPEFNWMLAACHFLKRDYPAAEAPLSRIYHSPVAGYQDKSAASQGLIGVYQKTGRPVDQLQAAFLYHLLDHQFPAPGQDGPSISDEANRGFLYWPFTGWLFDLPYLLDVQLNNQDLESYLKKYNPKSKAIVLDLYNFSRKRSAREMVEYALAVRYARESNFQKAAEIYEKVHANPRAKRMRILAGLYDRMRDDSLGSGQRLEAQFAYADFIARHPNQIFFNDMLWYGFQQSVFLGHTSYSPDNVAYDGMSKKEREFLLKQERKVKDDQEERWQAYKLFSDIVEKTDSDIGVRSAKKALRCLNQINTDRFGRAEEIQKAQNRLIRRLGKGPKDNRLKG